MTKEEKKAKRAERKRKSKGFFGEFRAFISRGNVVDLAVGVIIGGAFSAIVTALTANILQPLINWLIASIGGKDALASARTILSPAYDAAGKIDWSGTIYIDWGAFISAIINFLLIAVVLFAIVKIINTVKEQGEKLKAKAQEDYYKKHPEERPVPPEPGVPEPTDHELLKAMLEELKKNNNK